MKTKGKKALLILAPIISICVLVITVNAYLVIDNRAINTTGTIVYLDLEGGFYGIIGDDDNHYDPTNLPTDFEIDGLRVAFSALRRDDLGSFHMWGIIIQIINIQLI
jgi:inhibitor of cysteine peptidase